MSPWHQNLPLWVTFLPLLGALLLLFVPKAERRTFELGALAFTVADFLLSVPLWFQYDRASAAVQWAYSTDWIPSIGVKFSVGMDGISLVLFLLTTLLGFIVVWCSFTAINERHKEYYIWLLVMQFSMLGVFITQDMFQFYLFWELMLVPMYFLIAIWGGPQKLYAAIKLFLYTLAGSVLMLVAILAIYFLQYKTTGHYDMSIACFQAMAGHHRPAEPHLPDPAGRGLLPGLRHQGAHVPLPHLAARRPRGGAHGRLRGPGRRPAEDGDLRLRALPAAHRPRRHQGADALVHGPRPHRRHLRRPGGHDPEGHEEAGGLLLREPPGPVHAGPVRPQPQRHHRRHPPDAQPRHLHVGALPHRGHRLRAAPHAPDRGVRRPVQDHAPLRHRSS